jgi:hypothetical protein
VARAAAARTSITKLIHKIYMTVKGHLPRVSELMINTRVSEIATVS